MMAPDRIKVLIADDQTLFRTGLARMLSADPRVEVVGQAANGEEAVEQALMRKPNVVLMDLQMPKISGVEATRRLLRETSGIHVLVLSAYADKGMVSEALAAGAEGYVDKDVTVEDIVNRVLTFSPAGRRVPGRTRTELSLRELHVLNHVATGLSNKQIARRLGISEKTVRNHLSRVFSKLGATNRTEAVIHAIQAGLVMA
jgi:DNA-binding NarL/FixJ family response regulator